MKRLVSLPLALSFAISLPLFAYAASDNNAANGQERPAVSGGSTSTDSGIGTPAGSMAAQKSPSKDGVSRDKSDCVKTGCVDSN